MGIIGGGMMGLAVAFYLSREGIKVNVLEKEEEIGGLSRSEEVIPGFRWDRFYHAILSTDKEFLEFVNELGLSLDVRFTETRTGFYTGGQLYSMSSTWEFLTFKPLSLWDKFRLGVGILYAVNLKNWKRLEKIYVKDWLIKVFGKRNYEKMWDPLLMSKFGDAGELSSAAFIWATIKRLYGTRNASHKKEVMGCVRGGYNSIMQNVQEKLKDHEVQILVNHEVTTIKQQPDGVRVYCKNEKFMDFDFVVITVPNPVMLNIFPSLPNSFRSLLDEVSYLSMVCLTLVLRRSLCPYYVINLTDSGFPFTGLIEATNIIPPELLDGRALVYLPKYLPPDDPFFEATDEEISNLFLKGLKRIFPDLSDEDIIAYRINRERYVQPIHEISYSEKIPPMHTPCRNGYMVNTTMILNSTLNNNQVIHLARKMARILLLENTDKIKSCLPIKGN